MRYDSYCGLYCGACEVLLANERGLLEEKAKKWKVKAEEIKCNGCKSDVLSKYCLDCKIKSCAESKNLDYCFQCPDYPCRTLKRFKNDRYAHHSIVFHNLNFIRENGIDAWIRNQETRWSCSECGMRFSWYDTKCSSCGKPVKNCKDDEKEIASISKE